ncbi:MAG: hypothetical protein H6742_14550 [Alphaproteobacteria bacterium]|nr:hypothetical protein [Alphaproteobacteria bacterium]
MPTLSDRFFADAAPAIAVALRDPAPALVPPDDFAASAPELALYRALLDATDGDIELTLHRPGPWAWAPRGLDRDEAPILAWQKRHIDDIDDLTERRATVYRLLEGSVQERIQAHRTGAREAEQKARRTLQRGASKLGVDVAPLLQTPAPLLELGRSMSRRRQALSMVAMFETGAPFTDVLAASGLRETMRELHQDDPATEAETVGPTLVQLAAAPCGYTRRLALESLEILVGALTGAGAWRQVPALVAPLAAAGLGLRRHARWAWEARQLDAPSDDPFPHRDHGGPCLIGAGPVVRIGTARDAEALAWLRIADALQATAPDRAAQARVRARDVAPGPDPACLALDPHYQLYQAAFASAP